MAVGLSFMRASLLGFCLVVPVEAAAEGAEANPSFAPAPGLDIRVRGDRLSAKLDKVALQDVLAALAQQIPIAVSFKGPVGQKPIATTFQDLPLEEGLRRILQGQEYAIIHMSPQVVSRPGRVEGIREILVFSRPGAGSGDQWTQLAQKRAPSFEDLRRQAFKSPNPGDRAVALEELRGMGEDDEIVPILTRALQDKDSGVRQLALELLEDTLAPLPQEPVAQIALKDRNPRLRATALNLLAYRGEENAIGTLKNALQDPDSRVRETAATLLDELGVMDEEMEGEAQPE